MDRQFFKQGAYYIDAENIISEANLIHTMKIKLGVHINDLESILQLVSKRDILFLIDNCDQLYQKDFNNLMNFIVGFMDSTSVPKMLVVSNFKKD